MMNLQQALAWIPSASLVGDGQTSFVRVHTDTRSLQAGDLFVALVFNDWNFCGLPRHGLPLPFSFDEGACIEEFRNGHAAAVFGRPDQAKGNNCRRAVLLYADVFGGVHRFRVFRFRSRSGADAFHDVGLSDTLPRTACVDQILGPKTVVDSSIVASGTCEEFV